MERSAPQTLTVFGKDGEPVGNIPAPSFLKKPIRKDLIKRAYLSATSASHQPQGRDPMAGERTSAESMGVGLALARVPRERGSQRAAFAPMTVGGRRTHPPKPQTKIHENINEKERRFALVAAIAATASKAHVEKRGHVVNQVAQIPVILDDEAGNLSKTSEVRELFTKLGLWQDIERAKAARKVRAGKGKRRGRKYSTSKSVLVVVGEDKGLPRAARNLPGVEIINARNLGVLHLARGANPGRLTVYTQSAMAHLNERLMGEAQ